MGTQSISRGSRRDVGADALGKTGRVVCSFWPRVNVRAALELCEGECVIEVTALVEQFVGFAIGKDAPVPRHPIGGGVLRTDARSAVAW
jgi:hypothetical protein